MNHRKYESICMHCPQQADLEIEDEWLPRVGWGVRRTMEMMAECGISF